MKIFQSNRRILAAQILAILQHDTQPLYQLTTDAESVQVDQRWMIENQPAVGGHVIIEPGTGLASYMSAIDLATAFELVGMADLAPAAQQGEQLPEPEDTRDMLSAADLPLTYTFEQFVDFGRKYAASLGANNMPWSFKFYGRAVSHERDDCYMISDGAKVHYFTPEWVIELSQSEDPAAAVGATAITLIAAPALVEAEGSAQ